VDKLWEDKRREREREEAEAGYRTKNKNPTQRWGKTKTPHVNVGKKQMLRHNPNLGSSICSGTTRAR